MLNEALRLPYRAADATGTLLVGSVLTGLTGLAVVGWLALLAVAPVVGAAATPVVFLLSLIVRGYLLRVVAAGISGQATAPSFVRWGSLLRNGARSAVVATGYFLPAAAFIGLAVGAGAATVIDPPGFSPALQAVAALAILVGGFGTLCYGLVYVYLRGAARSVLAATGSIRAALDVRRVLRLSVSGSYLGGWLVAMGLLLVGPLLVTPLVIVSLLAGLYDPVLTAVGGLLTVLVTVVLVFSSRISAAWATGRGAAPGLMPDEPAVDDGTTAPSEPTATVALSQQPPEAPAAVQVGRAVASPSTASDDSSRAAGNNDDRRIDFRMPEPTMAEGASDAQTSAIDTDASDNNTTDTEDDATKDEAADSDEAKTDDRTLATDGSTTYERATATDESGGMIDDADSDSSFEWGVVEEK